MRCLIVAWNPSTHAERRQRTRRVAFATPSPASPRKKNDSRYADPIFSLMACTYGARKTPFPWRLPRSVPPESRRRRSSNRTPSGVIWWSPDVRHPPERLFSMGIWSPLRMRRSKVLAGPQRRTARHGPWRPEPRYRCRSCGRVAIGRDNGPAPYHHLLDHASSS